MTINPVKISELNSIPELVSQDLMVVVDASDPTASDQGTTKKVTYGTLRDTITQSIAGQVFETDPVFTASPARQVTFSSIANWNLAFGWGDHALEGYVKGESDPVFSSSPAGTITSGLISNWNEAYSWGNPANQGFLTEEVDPIFLASPAANITEESISEWNTAYGWGDPSLSYVPLTRQVVAGTGLSGGGTLDQNRTVSVAFASDSEAIAGLVGNKSMTPFTTKAVIDSRVVDDLVSTSTTSALSAAQGKLLQDSKASLNSPVFVGTPRAPTPAIGTSDTQVATAEYVQTVFSATLSGLTLKAPCKAATTGNITLFGEQTIDGVFVSSSEQRVLVKDQTNKAENGIYIASSGAWSRATDFDSGGSGGNVVTGSSVFIESGLQNVNTNWALVTNAPITVGVTLLTFVKTNSAGEILAGDGLTKTGNTISLIPLTGEISVSPTGVVSITSKSELSLQNTIASRDSESGIRVQSVKFSPSGSSDVNSGIFAETESGDITPFRRIAFRTKRSSDGTLVQRMIVTGNGRVSIGNVEPDAETIFNVSYPTSEQSGSITNMVGVSSQVVGLAVTGNLKSFRSRPSTTFGYSSTRVFGFSAEQGSGGISPLTGTQYGFYASETLISANKNYGFFSNIPTSANRWNFYADGTAPNFFKGRVFVGSDTGAEVDDQVIIDGSVRLRSGEIRFPDGSTQSRAPVSLGVVIALS